MQKRYHISGAPVGYAKYGLSGWYGWKKWSWHQHRQYFQDGDTIKKFYNKIWQRGRSWMWKAEGGRGKGEGGKKEGGKVGMTWMRKSECGSRKKRRGEGVECGSRNAEGGKKKVGRSWRRKGEGGRGKKRRWERVECGSRKAEGGKKKVRRWEGQRPKEKGERKVLRDLGP